MSKSKSGSFVFRKSDSIGANDAENDSRFLASCFEDTGDLDILASLTDPKRIVVGRTGSGKSAILLQLQRQRMTVLPIEPESLSLNYIANSTIIRFLHELNINLDPFFKLLWRHVFAITLLQERYDIHDEASSRASFFSKIFESKEAKANRFAEQERRKKALAYLERWGSSFWKDIDIRTREITTNFETEVKNRLTASTGIDAELLAPISMSLNASGGAELETLRSLGKEQKYEISHRAQEVINEIQVKELSGMLDFLDEMLVGSGSNYYITIDRLDDNWVDDRLRFRLIKALIDTVREFGKVHGAKVIIALRLDLIEKVFSETKGDAGFQEEKYKSLYLPLSWSKPQLIRLLNKRISELIRDRYTGSALTYEDILPRIINKEVATDYILDRTWRRPRDVIDFFNACIKRADGKAVFNKEIIADAEGEYSQGRLRSILEEWHALHPLLNLVIDAILRRSRSQFKLGDFVDNKVDEFCLQIVCQLEQNDSIYKICESHINGATSHSAVRSQLAEVLYHTGVIALKTAAHLSPRSVDNESSVVSPSEIGDDNTVFIHPGLWRALGINPV